MKQRQKRHLSLGRMIPVTTVTFLNGLRFQFFYFQTFLSFFFFFCKLPLLLLQFSIACLHFILFFPKLQASNKGSLQIICEYYRLHCPARGSTTTFHPLEHLHPLEFHRPDETVLHIAGSTIDLRSCSTSLELAEVVYYHSFKRLSELTCFVYFFILLLVC